MKLIQYCYTQMKETSNEDPNENLVIDVNRYEVEQSAIFQDYSREALLHSVQNYKSLNIYQRNSLSKNIDSIRSLYMGQNLYYQLLQTLACDHEDIQRDTLTFIKNLQYSKTEINFRAEVMNPLLKIFTGTSLQLKEAGCLFLQKLIPSLNKEEREQLLQLVYSLEKKQDEESKIVALQIVSRLSKDLSQAEISQSFATFFKTSYVKGSVRLKKQIINNTSFFAQGVSQEFFHFQIFQEFFEEKCRQPIWGIRKSCVQALPQLVKLTTKNKKDQLSKLLLTFTKDGSKIVRLTAFKAVPEFIANYDSTAISNAIFQLYCSLPNHQINKQVNRQNQILQRVAFYLPGILQVCGTSKWPQIKDIMEKLIDMKNEEVRLPIASSIHQIARIIGSGLASQVMFRVVDKFLKVQSQQLNLAVVKRFTDFMGVFDKTTRQNLIDFFLVLQNDPKKWRVRFEIARQLGLLTDYYQVDVIFQYILPICLKLCNDSRNSVRQQAASHMHQIVAKMEKNQNLQDSAIDSIICLGNSTVYIQRRSLAFMVGGMSQISAFRTKMKEMLLQLSKDKVIGVRVALAHSLRNCDKSKDWILQLQSTIAALSADEEECVRAELNQ